VHRSPEGVCGKHPKHHFQGFYAGDDRSCPTAPAAISDVQRRLGHGEAVGGIMQAPWVPKDAALGKRLIASLLGNSRISVAAIQDDARGGKSKVSEFSAAKLIIVIATLQAGRPRGAPGTLGDRGDALDLIRQKLVDLRANKTPRAGQDLDTWEEVTWSANIQEAVNA
jgi:hypothetical protein